MSLTKHAMKLATISRISYSALIKHLSLLDEYLEGNRHNWKITPNDSLDVFIQTFIYLSYKMYIECYQIESFNLITKEKRFIEQFSHNLFADKPIPSELIEYLINPVIDEIKKWDLPKKGEIDNFFIFYGIFLRFYHPDIAQEAGIVYTPKSIVNFIIHGIHQISIHQFGIESGLKNRKFPFRIVDPAAGTLNFIVSLLQFLNKSENELRTITNKILTMELKELPYIIGINEILTQINPNIKNINFYLRNALTEESFKILDEFLIEERDPSISIILGNPPYYINTQNNLPWIQTEIKEYKKSLKEKNLKILSDDYVKFFRIAQKLFQEKLRTGMVAFITNNNYLDGPVFKLMRKSLVNTFNEIYVVNLHGNLRKNETGNPFNIKVGVSIIFLLRTDPEYNPDPNNTLSYLEYGDKSKIHYWDINSPELSSKFETLSQGFRIDHFKKMELTPDYFFIPREYHVERRFQQFTPINELFLIQPKSGIMSGRDSLVSNPNKAVLKENMSLFFHRQFEELRKLNITANKTKTWDPEVSLQRSSEIKANNSIIRYNYRGFIQDFLVYDKFLVDGCRLGYLDKITSVNPAICVTRSIRTSHFSHALVVDLPPEKCLLGIKDSSYVFPLYQPQDLNKFNLNLTITDCDIEPILLFYYIYAILYSPSYRLRYVEQLKRHFPRIPFPKNNKNLIMTMAKIGQRLVEIHLGKVELSTADFKLKNPTNLMIQDYKFEDGTETIKFNTQNDSLSISNISKEMWNFDIGGIKQLQYWLRSRKFSNDSLKRKKRHIGLTRPITKMELNEFLEICSKIKYTLEILPKINDIFKQIDIS